MASAGEIVSAEALLQAIGYRFSVNPQVLVTAHLTNIRRKGWPILTIHGEGYMADVRTHEDSRQERVSPVPLSQRTLYPTLGSTSLSETLGSVGSVPEFGASSCEHRPITHSPLPPSPASPECNGQETAVKPLEPLTPTQIAQLRVKFAEIPGAQFLAWVKESQEYYLSRPPGHYKDLLKCVTGDLRRKLARRYERQGTRRTE
jgi:hypothetical protein